MNLYQEYLRRLIEVNDETVPEDVHLVLKMMFNEWKQGVEDATGERFNGDLYYLALFDDGILTERPMCCGEFLDWREK